VNFDYAPKLDLEWMRLISGFIQQGDGLGCALELEILRLARVQSTEPRPRTTPKLRLEWLRMAADCMQLVGDVQNPNLQRQLLALARRLTADAEAAPIPVCQPTI
jgi:hypothetical protein